MDTDIRNLDWALLQAFLTVAETGSLSAAARQSGQSQPTLGRQVKAIESALAVTLFVRQPRGLQLSDTGAHLLPLVQQMRDAAKKVSLIADGKSQAVSGVVRVTASMLLAHYSLPLIIAKIRHLEPFIEIELVPTDSSENLLFREADIAIRMYRPQQEDIIAKKLGELSLGLYAHRSYLERNGTPTGIQDFPDFDVVGMDRDTTIIEAMNALGIPAKKSMFAVRCDQQATYWALVCAGCGIGATQVQIGESNPDMVRVLPDLPLPTLPVWLAAPEALRNTPRIRRVYDLLSESISALTDA